jgi:hypothetical protein
MSREDNNDSDKENEEYKNCKLPAQPSSKRKQANHPASCTDFNARTVHQVSGFMVNGSPATQLAALAMLDNLSSSSKNVSQTLVQSALDSGSVSEGMSQEVVKTLLHAEKLRACV